ncbi:DUF5655 domain-containing protein [Frigoriglobus tundricola]|uniref:DUF5655 domain-containing protein n=1 Tax=Frigoriglobus tundricola TaxID=2774151 RepID=A0A6M5YUJ8_9BACT|nr:DUF5655 domain-containing protein [Frigoriglobus tundricola]QJW96973.1 hypothetical protein FTUN_4533 [Frigoriglobus tundricola]
MDVAKAKANQLANIEKRSGKSLAELAKIVAASGLAKHGAVLALLKEKLGLTHGDANAIALYARSAGANAAPAPAPAAAVDALYAGPKAALRPIHDALIAKLTAFGDFEIAPKKGYLSLRRAKQFASVTPATKTRLDIGIILKNAEGTDRFVAQPAKAMFPFKVGLTSIDEIDAELLSWLKNAFTAAA